MAHSFAGPVASFLRLWGHCRAEMIETITMHRSKAAGRHQAACSSSSDPSSMSKSSTLMGNNPAWRAGAALGCVRTLVAILTCKAVFVAICSPGQPRTRRCAEVVLLDEDVALPAWTRGLTNPPVSLPRMLALICMRHQGLVWLGLSDRPVFLRAVWSEMSSLGRVGEAFAGATGSSCCGKPLVLLPELALLALLRHCSDLSLRGPCVSTVHHYSFVVSRIMFRCHHPLSLAPCPQALTLWLLAALLVPCCLPACLHPPSSCFSAH